MEDMPIRSWGAGEERTPLKEVRDTAKERRRVNFMIAVTPNGMDKEGSEDAGNVQLYIHHGMLCVATTNAPDSEIRDGMFTARFKRSVPHCNSINLNN
jgi:hypothetical protein